MPSHKYHLFLNKLIPSEASQDTCDATKAQDGSSCVWCSVASYGVCVSGDVAEQMKQTIPGMACDDDGKNDDDKAPDDDSAPKDDDTAPSDDSVPDDYWDCLEKYSTSDTCTGAGCAWCDNKGGYGVCFDKDTAKDFKDSDWYSCTIPSFDFKKLEDPSDPSCLVATLNGDESSCKSTMDADGKPCDWCSFQGYEFCINIDQAQIVETYGADCGDRVEDQQEAAEVSDPSDPTCLAATIGGDESSCKATKDTEGNSCEWCSLQGYDFCLNDDQAQVVGQYGASCNESGVSKDKSDSEVSDPSDPACLAATIGGDESSCKATKDTEGNSCEWCSFQGYDFCLNDEQAQVVEQYGASCGERGIEENNASTSVA